MVVSGDTRPSDNLMRWSRGVDCLVHECCEMAKTSWFPDCGWPTLEDKIRDLASYHTQPDDTGRVAAGVVALDVLLPPLVLSVARAPWTFFTFNPWLKSLPAYLASGKPWTEKLDFLTRVALFWFSADGPYGAPEWGFAVDTMDVARLLQALQPRRSA